jgi:2-polyprenyl-3-methyl-5-hydroxy-6-metoxy-1,4-benzoquinol methylase
MTRSLLEEYYEANRKRWDELVDIHAKSDEYDLDSFLAGKNSLHSVELEALGEVEGKSLLHLQCHFGLDTLSWARLGAKVTGVDFSESAIELAKKIAYKIGVEAEFICSNVYDLPKIHQDEYDIVFTSYGVLCWLQNIWKWGRIIAHYLRPGGTFLLIDSHPFMWVFDDEDEELKVKYSYWHSDEPLSWEVDGSYADEKAMLINKKTYEWQHTVSDILNSLIEAGLTIRKVEEHPYLPWKYVQKAEQDGRYWRIQGDPLPQLWSIKAVKPPHP